MSQNGVILIGWKAVEADVDELRIISWTGGNPTGSCGRSQTDLISRKLSEVGPSTDVQLSRGSPVADGEMGSQLESTPGLQCCGTLITFCDKGKDVRSIENFRTICLCCIQLFGRTLNCNINI